MAFLGESKRHSAPFLPRPLLGVAQPSKQPRGSPTAEAAGRVPAGTPRRVRGAHRWRGQHRAMGSGGLCRMEGAPSTKRPRWRISPGRPVLKRPGGCWLRSLLFRRDRVQPVRAPALRPPRTQLVAGKAAPQRRRGSQLLPGAALRGGSALRAPRPTERFSQRAEGAAAGGRAGRGDAGRPPACLPSCLPAKVRPARSQEGKMARLSAFQLAELGLSAAAFLCGIICASALTVTQGDFGSQCVLYGSVRYNGTLSLSRVSHSSLCYFVSASAVLASIVSFAVLFQGIYRCCFAEDGQPEHTWFKGSVAISAAVLFVLLVSGCILRVGMDALCSAILRSSAAASCQEAQRRPWVPPYRAEKFYDNLYTAEAAAWVNFFFWSLMVVLLILERVSGSSYQPLPSSSARTDEAAPIVGGGPRGP